MCSFSSVRARRVSFTGLLIPAVFQEIHAPIRQFQVLDEELSQSPFLHFVVDPVIGLVLSFAGVSPHSFSHHPDVPATNALGSSQTETSITVGIAALEAVLSLRHQKGCTTWAGSSRRNFLGASQQAGGSCRRRLTLNLDEDMTRRLVISSSRPVVQSTCLVVHKSVHGYSSVRLARVSAAS